MRTPRLLLFVVLAACGTTPLLPDPGADGGVVVDAGAADAGLPCGPATCAGCCMGEACVIPSLQDDSACGLHGRQCFACGVGTEVCFVGVCTQPPEPRDAGSSPDPVCYLARPTTSCDDQGGPASGLSATKGRCELRDGGVECDCVYQKNPLTGRCLGPPTGSVGGTVCSLDYEGCSTRTDCCNTRHSCFPEGCHY